MKLRKYLEEKASEWGMYQRPAVDWMTTETGKPNSRLERTMLDFPEFGKVVKQIPCPLSRIEIYECYRENLYKGLVASLLWDRLRQEPFNIYLLLPFLVEPVENVWSRLYEIQKHIQQGDIDLGELFIACGLPSRLQIAERINYKVFTMALDHLAMGCCNINHPLVYNSRMKDVHCALLLEEEGTTQPFYDIKDDKVVIGEDSSEAKCYEDYCKRMGDIALWAGCGNPEFLVDWMNYSDDGRVTHPIAKEVLLLQWNKLQGKDDPSSVAISLAEFEEKGCSVIGNKNAYYAYYATNLYMEHDGDKQQMMQLLRNNDLINNRAQYAVYDDMNKGCDIRNPFSIAVPWGKRSCFEKAIIDYILFWSSPAETHRELTSITMHVRGSKRIESRTYDVYREGKKTTESYYFDLTQLFNQQ